MRIQAAVNIDDLTRYIAALVRSKIYAHMTDIIGAAVAVNHNVAQENILENLRNMCFVFGSYDKSWSYAVAADVLFAVLQSG